MIAIVPNTFFQRRFDARRKNLVIVRAGDGSLHERWLAGQGKRSWDLWVSYFGDDESRFRRDDCPRFDLKGAKWPALHALIAERWAKIERYDYVWLPDDDLDTDMVSINRLFDACRTYRLELAQPALSPASHLSHLVTLVCPTFQLRFTNFVEIMAPCFAIDLLSRCLPTFADTLSGWGLDFVWPRWTSPFDKIAVVDSSMVTHTRPVGGPNYKFLAERGITAEEEQRMVLNKYGGEPRRPQVIGGITTDGNRLSVWDASHPALIAKLISGYAPLLTGQPDAMAQIIFPSLVHLPPLQRDPYAHWTPQPLR